MADSTSIAAIPNLNQNRGDKNAGCVNTSIFIDLHGAGLAARKAAISNIRVQPLETSSNFVKPMSVFFEQSGQTRRWDMVQSHPSVAVVIYHTELQALILVRQFRPPVFVALRDAAQAEAMQGLSQAQLHGAAAAAAAAAATGEASTSPIGVSDKASAEEMEKHLEGCFTYELCAGIVDKQKSLSEIAREEVFEETGFSVPAGSLREVAVALTAVGISGAKQTLFYTEVSGSHQTHSGGGNVHEGEAIDVVALPVSNIDAFLSDPDIPKTPGALFGIMWFKSTVLPTITK